jgi:DNA polymerase I-like protein with 3'-5' exonuclease and polymerase domains
MPGQEMYRKLLAIFEARAPVAIDIETNMAGTLITAIGFANGEGVVSVPWDGYAIAGTNGQMEMGLLEYPLGAHIKRLAIRILENPKQAKILHNGAFDVVQLKRHGITLGGFEHDTLLLHRVCYPQYRHGLQQACATEFVVEPWKCLFKPPRVKPDEDHWLGCPVELRQYNCKDSFATWKLWQSLERKLG